MKIQNNMGACDKMYEKRYNEYITVDFITAITYINKYRNCTFEPSFVCSSGKVLVTSIWKSSRKSFTQKMS